MMATTNLAATPAAPHAALDTAALARRIADLPPLPQALREALRVLRDERLSATRCVELVERDQALAVRVLRLANSPFYGMSGRVASVGDAVQLLGLRTVAGVLAAVALRSSLADLSSRGFDFEAYWRHAAACGVAARALAGDAGLDGDEGFLAGLLHDIGLLVLAAMCPDEAGQVRAVCREEGVALHEAELRVLGMTHADVGARVAAAWNLPHAIVDAIACHHKARHGTDRLVADLPMLIEAADHWAHLLDGPEPATGQAAEDGQRLVQARLGLSDEAVERAWAVAVAGSAAMARL